MVAVVVSLVWMNGEPRLGTVGEPVGVDLECEIQLCGSEPIVESNQKETKVGVVRAGLLRIRTPPFQILGTGLWVEME